MRSSGGRRPGSPSSWADARTGDPSDEERAVRALEWAVIAARRSAEADRRRRLRALEGEIAEGELRARRDADRQRHEARVEMARRRFDGGGGRERPAVDLARLADVSELRIVPL